MYVCMYVFYYNNLVQTFLGPFYFDALELLTYSLILVYF